MSGDKRYYVYMHKEDDGTVLYVGVGTQCRAFRSVGSGHRKKEHSDWLDSKYHKGIIPVYFYATGLLKKEACSLEKDLIKELKPKFNLAHNPDAKRTRFTDEMKLIARTLRSRGLAFHKIAYLMGDTEQTAAKSTKAMSVRRMINDQ